MLPKDIKLITTFLILIKFLSLLPLQQEVVGTNGFPWNIVSYPRFLSSPWRAARVKFRVLSWLLYQHSWQGAHHLASFLPVLGLFLLLLPGPIRKGDPWQKKKP